MAVIRLAPNSPLINNFRYSTGDLAGKPLDAGTIDFFENDNRTTRQNTFSNAIGTDLNPNPLVATDVGTLPPIYMLEKPYYIVIKDKFGNVVATLENYLPAGDGGGGAATNTDNLFPSLGFDTQVFSDVYNDISRTLPSGTHPFSIGWLWEIGTTNMASSHYYTFTPLNATTIAGNPRSFVTFFSSNNSTGDSIKRVYTKLGGYNAFQGIQLTLAVYMRLIVGGFSTISVSLFRTKLGVPQPPHVIGTLPVPTAALEQEEATFIVPPLNDSGYANNDGLFLAFDFVLNQDFQFQMTSTWLQESPEGEVNVSEENQGLNVVKMLWNDAMAIEGEFYSRQEGGLPVITGSGGLYPAEVAGLIGKGLPNFNYPNYYNMEDDIELIATNVEAPAVLGIQGIKDDTEQNRLIAFLRDKGITKSLHTFVGTPVSTNQIDWGTGIGTKEKTTWVANAGGRVTLTKATDELIYHVSVTHENNKVQFTFTDDFAPGIIPHNPVYSLTGTSIGGTLYHTLPSSHPIVSWVGDNEPQHQIIASDTYEQNQKMVFNPAFKISTVALGSGSTPAIVDMDVPDSNLSTFLVATYRTQSSGMLNITQFVPDAIARHTSFNTYESLTHYHHAFSTGEGTYFTNYVTAFLSYNSLATNPATQPFPPRRMIKFSVDGVSNALAGVDSTAEVPILRGMTAREIARAIHDTINTSFKYDMLFTALPENGDYVTISNDITDYTVLWWDLAQSKPPNPTANRIIYVEFVTTQTITQVREETLLQVELSQAGIPLPQDFGLLLDSTFNYYMHA